MYFFCFFFKQKTAYEIMPSLVGSEMCIRDSSGTIWSAPPIPWSTPSRSDVTATDSAAALERALAVFDVVQVDTTTFTAVSLDHPGGRIFGGQVLAQALIAVGRTVAPERRPHSLHAYFLRAGTTDEPVTYEVEVPVS